MRRWIALLELVAFLFVFVVPEGAFASSPGSSTVSAGTAPPSAVTTTQSFQPDLFTGRATLSLPIVAPPGRRGLQPSLGLNYSSSGANGLCGVGWSIEGAAIERSTKRGVPRYDAKDTFQLFFQGISSELVSIDAGGYRTQDEQLFLRIRFNGSDPWEIQDKGGTTYRFRPEGGNPSGRIFRWELSEVQDTLGNTMTYESTQDQGASYPSVIRYTGHAVTREPPLNRVEFIYETRPDPIVTFQSGSKVTIAQRLKEIRTTAQEQLARIYRLEYTPSLLTGRSLLTSVQEIGADGKASLPATRFHYFQLESGPWYTVRSNTAQQGKAAWMVRQANHPLGRLYFGCLHPYTGLSWSSPKQVEEGTAELGCLKVTVQPDASIQVQGCEDFLGHEYHAYTAVYVSSSRTITLNQWGSWNVGCLYMEDRQGVQGPLDPARISLKTGWSILHLVGYHQGKGFSFGFSNSLKAQVDLVNPTPFSQPTLVGDYNGDGLTDLCTLDPSSGTWKVSIARTSLFSPEETWLTGWGSSGEAPLLGDWDQDGRTDVALVRDGNWRFARSTGTAFRIDPFPEVSGLKGSPLVGDFNGDELTDIGSYQDGTWQVALSTGNGFGFPQVWLNRSAEKPLIGDFNGDGLTDVAGYEKWTGDVWVALSNGSEFGPPTHWPGTTHLRNGDPTTADLNGDGKSDLITYNPFYTEAYMTFSTGTGFDTFITPGALAADFTLSGEEDQVQLQVGDFNGDGISDAAVFNPFTGAAEFSYSQTVPPALPHELYDDVREFLEASSEGARPDLLRRLDNPLGGRIVLRYQPSSSLENRYLPFSVPVVRQVAMTDGLGWSAIIHFLYQGGLFDTESREFRGFAEVAVVDPEGDRSITRFHQDTQFKGRPFEQQMQDAKGQIYTKALSAWECEELLPGVHFCHLVSQESLTFDGDATFQQIRTRYEVDPYGNLKRLVEEGDTSITGDERTTVTEYATNPSVWIMGKPSQTQLLDSEGQVVSQRSFLYDGHTSLTDPPTQGLLTEEIAGLDPSKSLGEQPTTRTAYDPYGNPIRVTDPLGRSTTQSYDSASHTFLERVANPLGHTLKRSYDPRSGAITATTDQNGQTTRFLYDPFGRTTAVIGPLDTEEYPGQTFEYDLSRVPSRTIQRVREQAGESRMLTSCNFADGLGRVIQVRAPAEDPSKQVVTGSVRFNSKGQVEGRWIPYLESSSTSYVAPSYSLSQVKYAYDPLGRLVRTTDPDGSIWQTQYQDRSVTKIDPNGHQSVHHLDARGRLLQVDEINGTEIYTTHYTTDAKGNLIQVKDHSGNVTRLQYDRLNRKIAMEDPDTGHWTYAYDAAGNLGLQTDGSGQTLIFAYDALNRLIRKQGLPAGSVAGTVPVLLAAYSYDETGHGFGIGALTSMADGSGQSQFTYDALGRRTQEKRTIDGMTYTFQRSYDLLGRLTALTYPDGEVVATTYNAQGEVESIRGSAAYLTSADYNAAGQLTRLTLGNGVTTDYHYQPQTQRIQSLKTTGSNGILQELSYSFDPVGNLIQLADWVHTATQSFAYDELNRLTRAMGPYGDFSYAYDPLGNLTFKEGTNLTYGLSDGTKPHAVTQLRRPDTEPVLLAYDPNGNLIQKGEDRFGYDAQNRLTEVHRVTLPEASVTYRLAPGWNLITVPLDVKDRPVSSLLISLRLGTDYDQLATPDAAPGRWLSFVGDPRFNEFNAMESVKGYEIYVTNPSGVTFTLNGKIPARRPVQALTAGWNLIPSPVLTETPVEQALGSLKAGVDYDELIRYDPTAQTWEAVSACRPGEAYWLHSLVAKDWTVPTPQGKTSTTTRMVYDADGNRVKLVTPEGTTTFVGPLYEVTGSKATKQIFLDSTRISSVTVDFGVVSSAPARRRLMLADLRDFFQRVETLFTGTAYAAVGARVLFYHTDHLGSVNLVTDHTGAQIELAEYSPFGSFSRKEVSPTSPPSPLSPSSPYFTGQRLDVSTGLYHYQARTYDPELGRFIQPDTIVQVPSDPQTLNRYTYARNNPLIFTDPTGRGFFKGLGNFFRQYGGTIATVAFAFAGMPFAGAFVGATLSTISNEGSFRDFAIGLGVGLAAGYVAGSLTGGFARIAGLNLAGLETAVLRGAASGALGGAAGAAIYGGDVGQGALAGAIGGAAIGSLIWGIRAYRTEQFIKNSANFDPRYSSSERAAMLRTIRESGQSPLGSRLFGRYLGAGATLSLAPEGASPAGAGLGPHVVTGTDSMYFNGSFQARFGSFVAGEPWGSSMSDATVFVHEMGHTLTGFGLADPLNVAYSENLYRGWVGASAREDYAVLSQGQGSQPVPNRSFLEAVTRTW